MRPETDEVSHVMEVVSLSRQLDLEVDGSHSKGLKELTGMHEQITVVEAETSHQKTNDNKKSSRQEDSADLKKGFQILKTTDCDEERSCKA
ncbi:hypothetical protein AVEN_41004-1 [Araneus ventricosus]|uniref:Uncharacterized protein n=1 Tax=Araneus ventricosus TaxID=182803 RepID=A0A4Y2U2U1_ARAVE|nr:hypothetical protein AVEN_41004-1 [Araneus ventricosus]